MSHYLVVRSHDDANESIQIHVVQFVEQAPTHDESLLYSSQVNGWAWFVSESDKSKEDFCQGLLNQLSHKERELFQAGKIDRVRPIEVHGSTTVPEFCEESESPL